MATQQELSVVLTREFLQKRYVDEDKFAATIAREVGCSVVTVTTYLRKYGFEVAKKYDRRKYNFSPIGAQKLTEEFLHREYVDKQRTVSDIAFEVTCSPTVVRKRLVEEGISIENHRKNAATTFTNGVRVGRDGYIEIYMPNHPDTTNKGYVRLHRLLAAYKYGRQLTPDEVVHHINGNTQDNRFENLEVLENSEHTALHNTKTHVYKPRLKRYADLVENKQQEPDDKKHQG